MSDDSDLDLLLQGCASSDEDDLDLPELDRCLEEILRSAHDEEEAPDEQQQVEEMEAEEEKTMMRQEKQTSPSPQPASDPEPRQLDAQREGALRRGIAGVQQDSARVSLGISEKVEEEEEKEDEEEEPGVKTVPSPFPISAGDLQRAIEDPSGTLPPASIPQSLDRQSIAESTQQIEPASTRPSNLDGSSLLHSSTSPQQLEPRDVSSSSNLPVLKERESTRKEKMLDPVAKSTSRAAASPYLHRLAPSKPSTSRPGAAVAAAAAASRQAAVNHGSDMKKRLVSDRTETASTSREMPFLTMESKVGSVSAASTVTVDKSSIGSETVGNFSNLTDRLQVKVGNSSPDRNQVSETNAQVEDAGKFGHQRTKEGLETDNGISEVITSSTGIEVINHLKGKNSQDSLNGQAEIGKDEFQNEGQEDSLNKSSENAVLLAQDNELTPAENDQVEDYLRDDLLSSSDQDNDQDEITELLTNRSLESSSMVGLTSPEIGDTLESLLDKTDTSTNEKLEGNITSFKLNALQLAEETEKKAAFSGLHLEEGAAAQPMRLEGIQRGPPAIGFLHLDSANSLSQALASQAMHRDHGSPRALALHSSYVAIGMSKGAVLVTPLKHSGTKSGDIIDSKAFFLGNANEKSNASVTSMSFNQQGDLLLVGHANGSLALWDVPKAASVKVISGEHAAAVVHVLFLGQDIQMAKHPKAVSADCKGILLLHTFTMLPLLRRFSVTSQCLLDGQRTGMVLSISLLLLDVSMENTAGFSTSQAAATPPPGLGSVVGGMVGGVVAGVSGDVGRKFLHDGVSSEEAGGIVVFVTQQTILVVRLTPSVEVYAKLSRPDGIRESALPYTAWRRIPNHFGASIRSSGYGSRGEHADHSSKEAQDSMKEFEIIKRSGDDIDIDNLPILALGWDKKVFVAQLLRGELKVLVTWDLDSVACGIAWLEERMLMVLTSKGHICLFTTEGVEVERATINNDMAGDIAIAYHTHIMNSFGNPEKAYHNSLAVRGASFYLLGPLQLWRACLLPWQDRIKALQDAGDWMSAFHAAMELYDGKTMGVTGLPRGLDVMWEVIAPSLLELLFAYIDKAFSYLAVAFGCPENTDEASRTRLVVWEKDDTNLEAKQEYARVGGVAIEFCVHIRQTDVLFDHVFSKFSAVGQRGTFLELLEPYILKDVLGRLAPEVMKALVEHYSQKGWLQRVEQCVLHMDIASLDFNQVVRLCRENGLYSALIYLFNKGLDDFKSPLEELLVVAQDLNKPNAQNFGYKMLVYLKYCFSGLAFPPGHGHLPSSRLPSLRAELLEFLLEDRSSARTFSERSREGSELNIINHSRLCFLISLDLHATLEVLKCAFPEDGPLGIGKNCLSTSRLHLESGNPTETGDTLKDGVKLVQAVVDALSNVLNMVFDESSVANVHITSEVSGQLWLSKESMGHILEFIASYVASGHAIISENMLAQLVEHLACTDHADVAQLEGGRKCQYMREKEKLLVRLLRQVSDSEWDSAHILELTLQAHFWQASAFVFAKKGDYVAALDSYMKDKDDPYKAFLFVLEVLSPEKELNPTTLLAVRKAILGRLPELLQLNSEATLVIILEHFSKESKLILAELAPYPMLLFEYLKAVMHARSQGNSSSSPAQSILLLLNRHESLSKLLQSSGMEFTDEMAELYVELLCQFEPKSVLKFLESYENYRLEHCLKLCQDYGITDAAAFLWERVGDVGSALSLVLADVDLRIHEMDSAMARLFAKSARIISANVKDVKKFMKIPEIAVAHSVMHVAVELCQRNTLRLDPVESEALWFRLLDRFVEPLRKLYDASRGHSKLKHQIWNIDHGTDQRIVKQGADIPTTWRVVDVGASAAEAMRRVLVYFISQIINGMMGYVPLTVIMEKLLADNGSHEFGDFKGTILEMLGSYGYEKAILSTAKHIVEDDTFYNISVLKKISTKAYAPLSSSCCICTHRLDGIENSYSEDNGHDATLTTVQRNTLSINGFGNSTEGKTDPKATLRHPAVKNGSNGVQVFFCGHIAHYSCVIRDLKIAETNQQAIARCPICAPRKNFLP